MNIPMRWGRTATRFAVGIRNRGRYSHGYSTGGSPDWWQSICKWAERRSQKRRRIAARRARG